MRLPVRRCLPRVCFGTVTLPRCLPRTRSLSAPRLRSTSHFFLQRALAMPSFFFLFLHESLFFCYGKNRKKKRSHSTREIKRITARHARHGTEINK